MARRQRHDDADSLELLLDTICNVFGGIVLMAILVVLQTQASVGRLPKADPQAADRAAEGRRLMAELEAAEARLRELTDYRDEVDRQRRDLSDEHTAELAAAYSRFRDAVTEARKRISSLRPRLDQAGASLQRGESEHGDLRRQMELREKEIEQLKQRLADLADRPRRGLRLPHRQGKAAGMPRYFLVKADRVFRFGAGGLPKWQGDPYAVEDCTVVPQGPAKTLGAAVTAQPGAGFAAGENAAPELRRAMQACKPATHYVFFFVYADDASFETFQWARKTVSELGYRYAVAPLDSADGPFIVTPTTYHETE